MLFYTWHIQNNFKMRGRNTLVTKSYVHINVLNMQWWLAIYYWLLLLYTCTIVPILTLVWWDMKIYILNECVSILIHYILIGQWKLHPPIKLLKPIGKVIIHYSRLASAHTHWYENHMIRQMIGWESRVVNSNYISIVKYQSFWQQKFNLRIFFGMETRN